MDGEFALFLARFCFIFSHSRRLLAFRRVCIHQISAEIPMARAMPPTKAGMAIANGKGVEWIEGLGVADWVTERVTMFCRGRMAGVGIRRGAGVTISGAGGIVTDWKEGVEL